MKKRRLLKLADLLERDARRKHGIKFDLSSVIKAPIGMEPAWGCGTMACALGLWAISGEFPGVTIEDRRGEFWPAYDGLIARDGAEIYFGINQAESGWLFLAYYYPEPTAGRRGELAVAKRIRNFVAGKASPL
jgi:hypothetical protein